MIRPLNAFLLSMLLLSTLFALATIGSARAQDLAPIPPLISPVVDTTGTLNAGEIAQLEQQSLALQQRKGSQLQILIVSTTRPEAIEQYAQRVFDEWKIGRQGVDDGVLLVVAKDDREVRIQPGYGLEGAIPDIAAGRIVQEYLVPKFRAGDFAGGIADASAQLVRLIDGESLPPPMAVGADGAEGSGWPPALFLAFFVSMFVRALLGGLPILLRMAIIAVLAAGVLWLFSAPVLVILLGALVGAIVGAIAGNGGGFAKRGSWGSLGNGTFSGGSWGGGSSSSSSSSSGWSGGGGRSGGGGASGRW
jgi:uncharacterized protein